MAKVSPWTVFLFPQQDWGASLVLIRKLPLKRDAALQPVEFVSEFGTAQLLENVRAFGLLSPHADWQTLYKRTQLFLEEKIPDGRMDSGLELDALFQLQWQFEEELLKPFLQDDEEAWKKANQESWYALLRAVVFAKSELKEASDFLQKVPWQVLLDPEVQSVLERQLQHYRQRSVSTTLQTAHREAASCLKAQFALHTYDLSCEPSSSHPVYEGIAKAQFPHVSQTENFFAQLLSFPELSTKLTPLILDFAELKHTNRLSLALAALQSWDKRSEQEKAMLEPLFAQALTSMPQNMTEADAWVKVLIARVRQGSLAAVQALRFAVTNPKNKHLRTLEQFSPAAVMEVFSCAVELLSQTPSDELCDELELFQDELVKLLHGESDLAKLLVLWGVLNKEEGKFYLQLEQQVQQRQIDQGVAQVQPDFSNLYHWAMKDINVFLRELVALDQFTADKSDAELPWRRSAAQEKIEMLVQDGRWYSLSALDLLGVRALSKLQDLHDLENPNAEKPERDAALIRKEDVSFFERHLHSNVFVDAVEDYQRVKGTPIFADIFDSTANILERSPSSALLDAATRLALSQKNRLASSFLPAMAEQVRDGSNGNRPLDALFQVFATHNDLFDTAQEQLQELVSQAYGQKHTESHQQDKHMYGLRSELASRLQRLVLAAAPDVAFAAFDMLASQADACEGGNCVNLSFKLRQLNAQRFVDLAKKGHFQEAAKTLLRKLMDYGNDYAFNGVLEEWQRSSNDAMLDLLGQVLSAREKDVRSKWIPDVVHAFAEQLLHYTNHPQIHIIVYSLLEQARLGNLEAREVLDDPRWKQGQETLVHSLQVANDLQEFVDCEEVDVDYEGKLDNVLTSVDEYLEAIAGDEDGASVYVLANQFFNIVLDDEQPLDLRLYILEKLVQLAGQGDREAESCLIRLEHILNSDDEMTRELLEYLRGSRQYEDQ